MVVGKLQRLEATKLYIDSYRRYCWPVQSVSDLKLAPFHRLATQGQVHVQRDHVWHMEKLAEVCKASDGLLLATSYRQVDVTDTASTEEATQWWEELTRRGGEGMVVKPLDFVVSLPSKASRLILACSFYSFLSPYNCCL